MHLQLKVKCYIRLFIFDKKRLFKVFHYVNKFSNNYGIEFRSSQIAVSD